MTSEQMAIRDRRLNLERRIAKAYKAIYATRVALRKLCTYCKHDDTTTFEQSASGNESSHVCDLCHGDV
jgi:CRISPR/Cas system-associated protein Cas10 (large subunit of type III CRISPR-Cas system)